MATGGELPNGVANTTGPAEDILSAAKARGTWDVAKVVADLPGGAPKSDTESPIPFFHMLERLKTTKREGWRRFGISQGESISDHMYRMSLITLFAPPALASKLDIPRCTKMALIHDMAEALVGDITPVDGVAKHEKSRREETTMAYFTGSLLGRVYGGIPGQEIMAIWKEYEDDKTLEAHFVHDVDKVELILQMVEYERVHEKKLDLGEFSWVASRIILPEVKEWSNQIMAEREVFWGDVEHQTYDEKRLPEADKLVQKLEYYGGGVEENKGRATKLRACELTSYEIMVKGQGLLFENGELMVFVLNLGWRPLHLALDLVSTSCSYGAAKVNSSGGFG